MSKTGPKPLPLSERFWRHVDKRSPDECWGWRGYKLKTGYGLFNLDVSRANKNKSTTASRVAWQLTYGEIPQGKDICHRCDNPPCVNPAHLWIGTPKENTLDMIMKDRHRPGWVPGEKNGQSILTESDVLKIREHYSNDAYSRSELASIFGVSQSAIKKVCYGYTWKHLKATVSDMARRERRVTTGHIGEKNPACKISTNTVIEIRKLYAEGKYSQDQIGSFYGLKQTHVSRIVRGESWKHISALEVQNDG